MVVGSTVTDSWQKQWQCGVAMRLSRRRRSCGMTQAQLADAIDVDRATVARWESGSRMPSALHAILIAGALDVWLHWLLLGDFGAQSPPTLPDLTSAG
jgi:transcriptional regulator with XRE-family HTH domain